MEFQEIQTFSAVLDMPGEADDEAIFEICQDPQIQEFILPIGKNYTVEKARTFLTIVVPKIWESGTGAEWVIRDKRHDSFGKVIGMTGVNFAQGELGIWLAPSVRGEGLGFEILSEVMSWANERDLTPNGFSWTTVEGNIASIVLAKKLGFGFLQKSKFQLPDGTIKTLFHGSDRATGNWPT